MNSKFLTIISTLFSIFGLIAFAKASVLGFDTSTPCAYWEDVFNFSMSAAGVLTLVMLVLGGLYYIVSLGQEEKLGNAKKMMTGAMAGFLLAIFSFLIFKVISPSLLQCRIDVPEVTIEVDTTVPSAGIGGTADPCAGVADEDLFERREACESGCSEGSCFQSPEAESAAEETSAEGESGQEAEEEGGGDDEEAVEEVQNDRAGKWCCRSGSADCAEVISSGLTLNNGNDTEGLRNGGLITRRGCNFCYDGPNMDPCIEANTGEPTPNPVQVNPRLCGFLVALKQAMDSGEIGRVGVGPILGTHAQCSSYSTSSRCNPNQNPPGCYHVSAHWTGNAVDIQTTSESVTRWVYGVKDVYGMSNIIGPGGWEMESNFSCEQGRARDVACHGYFSDVPLRSDRQGYATSPWNLPHRQGAGVLCGHCSHVHVGWRG